MRYPYRFILALFLILSPSPALTKGAGVIPLTFINGELYALLGREPREFPDGKQYQAWSDFGGGVQGEESPLETAYREFQEETGRHAYTHITLTQIIDTPFMESPSGYRLYFLLFDTKEWVSAERVEDSIRLAKAETKPNSEKNKVMSVKISELLEAADSPHPLMPGTNEPLFPPFLKDLQNQQTRQILFRIQGENPLELTIS